MHFLHTYLPEPVAFAISGLQIHWYGIFLSLGLIMGVMVLHHLLIQNFKDPEDKYTVIYYIVIPAILGARLYYVLYAWEFYKNDLLGAFRIWEGGLAIHGVIIGGLLGLYFYTRKHKESFLLWTDILVPCLAIGQAIGRWGNYFNQELYGKPTDLSWGIPIQNPTLGYEMFQYFHPTFLYESVLNLVLFGILIFLNYKKLQNSWRHGYILCVYIIGYAIIRWGMEFLRLDYSPIVFGFRWAQMVSVVLFIGGIMGCLYLYKSKKDIDRTEK